MIRRLFGISIFCFISLVVTATFVVLMHSVRLSDFHGLKRPKSEFEKKLSDSREIAKNSAAAGSDCVELLNKGYTEDGVYSLTAGTTYFNAYCEMEAGGWMIIQRRFDGSSDFKQDFQTFTDGFGDLYREHWIGLEKLHQLTSSGKWELRIDLEKYGGEQAYAAYRDFKVDEGPGYQLQVGDFTGTAGDSLMYHNGSRFSTHDRNQEESGWNCSDVSTGSWWYRSCLDSNLNSYLYGDQEQGYFKGMIWVTFTGPRTPVRKSRMKIRPQITPKFIPKKTQIWIKR